MAGCCVHRWSVSLGRWWGVAVRLHIFFLLFAVLALAFTIPADLAGAGSMAIGILLASLVLHEVGHALAAARVGGQIDAIVVGPVGGLIFSAGTRRAGGSVVRGPGRADRPFDTGYCPPRSCSRWPAIPRCSGLLHPLAPLDLMEGGRRLVAVKLTLWLNWILMLLNLLPAYPFDGGPILRAMLWPAVGRRTARVIASRVAMVIAVGVCASGLLSFGVDRDTRPVPMWIPLIILGIFLFFSAKQDVAGAAPHELFDDPVGYRPGQVGADPLEATWPTDDDEAVAG